MTIFFVTGRVLQDNNRVYTVYTTSNQPKLLRKKFIIVASTTSGESSSIPIDDIINSLEYKCLFESYENNTNEGTEEHIGCPKIFDSVLCWPNTSPDSIAVLPCFREFKGIFYDSTHHSLFTSFLPNHFKGQCYDELMSIETSIENLNGNWFHTLGHNHCGRQTSAPENATRYCTINSTWDNSNYDKCLHIANDTELHDFVPSIELPTIIYGFGYILSLSSLTLALIVFLHLKELRCLRNAIHANLFLTYILSGLLWILMLSLQITVKPGLTGCIVLVILFHYFSLTNFFWMLVEGTLRIAEKAYPRRLAPVRLKKIRIKSLTYLKSNVSGLYLYMLVVETFSSDKLKFKMYAVLGWVCPAIIIMIWAIVKSVIETPLGIYDLGLDPMSEHQLECTWMHESQIDWIYQGPVSACLVINSIFLLRIMWVLIIKLRSNNNVETRQYRKATKALLVLIPLLGITYLVVMAGPAEGLGKYIFAVIRALLISTQGFSISVFYCFLNSEVKQTIRQRFFRWQDERNIQYTQRSNNHQKL
ncbi:Diuretic hormone receptor, partial [Pseudolycoriella hygida]